MRHGEALSPQKDPERGLTDNGKSKVELVAKYLQKQGISFSQVFHSKKKRARETAEIMRDIIAPAVMLTIHDKITPNDNPQLIFSEINSWDKNTLITSHLPFVPNLITSLTGQDTYLSAISFETGTIVCLEKDDNDIWSIIWATSPSEILA